MIPYDLAVKLNDAGFKVPFSSSRMFYRRIIAPYDEIVCPTLDELIDASGKNFVSLENYGGKWGAEDANKKEYTDTNARVCVALLWLANHKK